MTTRIWFGDRGDGDPPLHESWWDSSLLWVDAGPAGVTGWGRTGGDSLGLRGCRELCLGATREFMGWGQWADQHGL